MKDTLYTDKQARELECPMARNQPNKHDRLCVAKDCIAWRWVMRADSRNGPQKVGYCGMVPNV